MRNTLHVIAKLAHSLKKKSETELTASVLKKIENTQEIKRTRFNWTKQDKTRKFSRKSSFSSYEQQQQKTQQQKNKRLIQLILCQLDVGGC